jgi:hypothetical protein
MSIVLLPIGSHSIDWCFCLIGKGTSQKFNRIVCNSNVGVYCLPLPTTPIHVNSLTCRSKFIMRLVITFHTLLLFATILALQWQGRQGMFRSGHVGFFRFSASFLICILLNGGIRWSKAIDQLGDSELNISWHCIICNNPNSSYTVHDYQSIETVLSQVPHRYSLSVLGPGFKWMSFAFVSNKMTR